MIEIKLSHQRLSQEKTQMLVVLCAQDAVLTNPVVQELQQKYFEPLADVVDERKFTAKAGSSLSITAIADEQPVYVLLIGLGDLSSAHDLKIERYRRALGSMIRTAEQLKIKTLALALPDAKLLDMSACDLVQETTTICMMAHYQFNDFITDADRRVGDLVMTLCVPEVNADECKVGLHRGERLGFAINQARHWCDLPGNEISPRTFAVHSERVAASHGLSIKVFGKQEIIDMGMGGIQAVSQGSAEEPRLVVMEYRTTHKDAPTIALVGKGVTFDSGGLSIKPAGGMETMKDDMAGAAVVMCTMEVLAHLKPAVNVVALAPLVENMPSGTAMRPGDIIRFYNGKTAEVKNTDAEGRLILADALAYAIKTYKPDALIDLATLTGACAYALGPFYAGLMSCHDTLAQKIFEASQRSGDRVWPLPMSDDFAAAIKSDVADISNTGNEKYRAGTITAAFFLKNFVGETPWAHIDIAGTAFGVPDQSYYRGGATGFGVRLLVDVLMQWHREQRGW